MMIYKIIHLVSLQDKALLKYKCAQAKRRRCEVPSSCARQESWLTPKLHKYLVGRSDG